MILTSTGIINGVLEERFGKFGEQMQDGIPTRSPELLWTDLPVETKSLALVMLDHDAIPVVGFTWIHWLVADIDPFRHGLAENASQVDDTLIQGKNSQSGREGVPVSLMSVYTGPRPPDRDHAYEFTLYALDKKLGLVSGFSYEELMNAMQDHIINKVILTGLYKFQK